MAQMSVNLDVSCTITQHTYTHHNTHIYHNIQTKNRHNTTEKYIPQHTPTHTTTSCRQTYTDTHRHTNTIAKHKHTHTHKIHRNL